MQPLEVKLRYLPNEFYPILPADNTRLNFVAGLEENTVARSIANLIWKEHFGVALTPKGLGYAGKPSQLLDWLAATLIQADWERSALDHLIETSALYQSEYPLESEIEEEAVCPRPRLMKPKVRR